MKVPDLSLNNYDLKCSNKFPPLNDVRTEADTSMFDLMSIIINAHCLPSALCPQHAFSITQFSWREMVQGEGGPPPQIFSEGVKKLKDMKECNESQQSIYPTSLHPQPHVTELIIFKPYCFSPSGDELICEMAIYQLQILPLDFLLW